jgi:mRNA-degrading endonuclease HigB of HigAB toxin-antitoxin module
MRANHHPDIPESGGRKASPRGGGVGFVDRYRAPRGMENPVEMKRSFPGVDPVKVKSGKTVHVCNIRRDEFRLVIAVHFDRARIYTLRFLTHAEYDRDQWKQEL